jgi:hypothetical protein
MTAKEYANLVAAYLLHNYRHRGIEVYREVPLGKSIIGKNRRLDIFVLHESSSQAYAIECKYQDSKGTADEKIYYALSDMHSLPLPGCLVYSGNGWSPGVLHTLQASEIAAYCCPSATLMSNELTLELDHHLAMRFGWWDILVERLKPFEPPQ